MSPKRSKASYAIVAGVCVFALACIGFSAASLLKGTDTTSESEQTSERTERMQSMAQEGQITDAVQDSAKEPSKDIVMALGGSKDTYVLAGERFLDGGCQVQDTAGFSISPQVEVTGQVDTSRPGDYEVTYTATMPDGRFNTATRNVHVVDHFDAVADSLPVLMYHYVYTEADPPENVDANHLLDTKLAAQLQYLNENGYYYPSFEEVRAFVDGTHTLPAKSVVLTFDDAEERFLNYGIPVLDEYQVPATSFVIWSDEDAVDKTLRCASPYVQFQSHSFDMHRAGGGKGQGGILHAMSPEQLLADATRVKEIIGEYDAMAYPYGDNSEDAWNALSEAGVLCAFTVKNAHIKPGDNPYALNRVRVSGGTSLEGFIGSL